MRTVSQVREAKRVAELQSETKSRRVEQIIQIRLNSIEKEKESIKDCIDQNLLDMAKRKIQRIEELRLEIAILRI